MRVPKAKKRGSNLRTRVRHLRSLSGLTASDLSELCGLSRTHLSLIENGSRSDPKGSTLSSIAKTLGVSVAYLIDGIGDEPTEAAVAAAVATARSHDDLSARAGS
jgi:transcriptional regulator with XRE-family HTH domain